MSMNCSGLHKIMVLRLSFSKFFLAHNIITFFLIPNMRLSVTFRMIGTIEWELASIAAWRGCVVFSAVSPSFLRHS